MIDACITLVDSGLFTELAVRLAREFRQVRSHVPWFAEFPTINDRSVGDGLSEEGVQWIEDPYLDSIYDTTDIYFFPDIFRAGEQQLLQRAGKPVVGSNIGDALETRRVWFRHLQEELGMPIPEGQVIEGWSNLVAYLKDHGHCFIKTTSKIRGSMETHEFFSYDQAHYWLDDLKTKLGANRERVTFLVEEPIDTPFETGLDTYSVRGQFPKTPMQGIEIKGKLMLSSAQTDSDTPRPLDDALSLLSPVLRDRNVVNFLSAEFRGDILTDICMRAPNPGIGCEMEMIRNIGEIIYEASRGNLVEPDFEAEFGIQAAIFHDHDKELWKQFPIPEDLRRWVKLMEFCKTDGLYQIIPRPPHGEKIGWLVGIGDSIEAAAEHLMKNKERLKEYPFDIRTDCLTEAIEQAHAMKKQGFEFSGQPLPEPETVETK